MARCTPSLGTGATGNTSEPGSPKEEFSWGFVYVRGHLGTPPRHNWLQQQRPLGVTPMDAHVHSVVSNSSTPSTIACQAPPSMGFSRQEYWSGLPFPSPGDLPTQGLNPGLPHCRQTPPSEPPGSPGVSPRPCANPVTHCFLFCSLFKNFLKSIVDIQCCVSFKCTAQ